MNEVAMGDASAVKVLEGHLGIGEEEDVDDGERQSVDVPYVKVMEEGGGLPGKLRDQAEII